MNVLYSLYEPLYIFKDTTFNMLYKIIREIFFFLSFPCPVVLELTGFFFFPFA